MGAMGRHSAVANPVVAIRANEEVYCPLPRSRTSLPLYPLGATYLNAAHSGGVVYICVAVWAIMGVLHDVARRFVLMQSLPVGRAADGAMEDGYYFVRLG